MAEPSNTQAGAGAIAVVCWPARKFFFRPRELTISQDIADEGESVLEPDKCAD